MNENIVCERKKKQIVRMFQKVGKIENEALHWERDVNREGQEGKEKEQMSLGKQHFWKQCFELHDKGVQITRQAAIWQKRQIKML